MLFENLRIRPAPGPIELRDYLILSPRGPPPGGRIFLSDLVDAILVAVERKQAPVAAQSEGIERIQDDVRGEPGVGMAFGGLHPPILSVRHLLVESGHAVPFIPETQMKNPLDSLWGTVISGLALTVVLYFLVRAAMGG